MKFLQRTSCLNVALHVRQNRGISSPIRSTPRYEFLFMFICGPSSLFRRRRVKIPSQHIVALLPYSRGGGGWSRQPVIVTVTFSISITLLVDTLLIETAGDCYANILYINNFICWYCSGTFCSETDHFVHIFVLLFYVPQTFLGGKIVVYFHFYFFYMFID